jgi:hypothetical protein
VFADNRPILTLYHQAIFASGTHTLKITPAAAKESGRSFTTRLQASSESIQGWQHQGLCRHDNVEMPVESAWLQGLPGS